MQLYASLQQTAGGSPGNSSLDSGEPQPEFAENLNLRWNGQVVGDMVDDLRNLQDTKTRMRTDHGLAIQKLESKLKIQEDIVISKNNEIILLQEKIA